MRVVSDMPDDLSHVVNKCVLVLIDGIGDVSVQSLNNLTPLQAAFTPAFDAIAAAGLNGLMDPVEPGLACGSDTAHLAIFGYDPRTYYNGRGAFESMGAGIHMEPGDIALKSNFATIDPNTGIILRRRADRNFEEEGPILCEALNGLQLPSFPDHVVKVQYATEHRCGVVVSGPGLSDAVTGTDPLKDNLALQKSEAIVGSTEAHFTALLVNELSESMQRILKDHAVNIQRVTEDKPPANVVLLRGCGSRIRVEAFETRHRLRGCMVAPTKIIAGLGASLGLQVLDVPEATGDYRTQFHAKAEAIADALAAEAYNFGFLHVKAVDDTGHDRSITGKVLYLEAVDKMLQQLIVRLATLESSSSIRFCVAVTGDHSTPVVYGDHSHEPVPFAVTQNRYIVDVLGKSFLKSVSMGPIPHPEFTASDEEVLQHLCHQAMQRRGVLQKRCCPTYGDCVATFDETTAGQGCLGRFPGSSVLPLLRELVEANY